MRFAATLRSLQFKNNGRSYATTFLFKCGVALRFRPHSKIRLLDRQMFSCSGASCWGMQKKKRPGFRRAALRFT